MSAILVAVLLVVAVLAIGYYLVKKFMLLVVNAILGLFLLFIMNFLHIMQWVEKPDLGYSLATLLICAIGGVPGVLILILLNLFGITLQ
ncbi:MAG TPA: pro-sigmaK processing inhibitor BofA family protein [Methanoregula sp.]|nr:pro-sigmaK processing inhibitor BofA family protein [Methanoregula sp.]